jgi:adenosylmethionine-8-amino-7-oxononanoate aminotransferase
MPKELSEADYVQSLLEEFENTIVKEGPETIAAFIAEPVVAAALGAVVPPKGYFKGMYAICAKYGILTISDEILSGFGRTGENFGILNFGVVPDIIAAGKGISGGYFPLSAVLASEKIVEPLTSSNTAFLGGHTFSCNPVGAAVGLKVLEIIKEEKLIENSKEMGKLFLEKLQRVADYEIVGEIRGLGLQIGIEFVQDKKTKMPFPAEFNLSKKIGEKSIEKGVVLYPGKGSFDGTAGDHVMITPALTINEDQLEEIVTVFDECIQEVMKEINSVAV